LAFLTQNKAKLCKMLIMTLVFEKNANFFDENSQKSQKIVIITSTPGVFIIDIYGPVKFFTLLKMPEIRHHPVSHLSEHSMFVPNIIKI
jgi:hypothetical protein